MYIGGVPSFGGHKADCVSDSCFSILASLAGQILLPFSNADLGYLPLDQQTVMAFDVMTCSALFLHAVSHESALALILLWQRL